MNIDLCSTTNFLKPTVNVDCQTLDNYNNINEIQLYKKISKLYAVKQDNIQIFQNNYNAIYSLLSLFETKLCYIYSPAPVFYKQIALKYKYTVELINRYVDLQKNIEANSLVIFANPSMPDGSFYDLLELLKIWDEKNCTILIDESFLDFTSFSSSKEFINKYKNLYILKSTEYFYSKFNISLVSILGNNKNILELKKHEPSLNLSHLDNIYIQNMLKDKSFAKVSRTLNITNKEYFCRILENSKYVLKVFPSSTNYILVQLSIRYLEEFKHHFHQKNVDVKECSEFDFLDDSFIRVSVKSEKELKYISELFLANTTFCNPKSQDNN